MMTTEASSSFASSSSASSSSSSSVSVSVSEDESLRDWNALPLCVLGEISSKIPASYLANYTWMFQQWRTMREQGTLASWHCRILFGQAELPAEFYTLWVYSDDSLFTVKFTESKGIAKPVRGKGLMNLNGVRVWGNSTGISLIQPKEGHPTLFLMNSTTGEVNKNIRDPPTKARVEYGIRNENEAVISFGMGDEGGDLYIGKVVEQDWACLYLLKKKRWSNISVFPYKSAQVSGCGVFLKNKIHWLVSRETDLTPVIVAMSLLGDLVEIPVLEEAALGPYTLACFDSCLCLMHYDDNIAGQEEQGHRSFWVLEDYSDISSWISKGVPFGYASLTPLCNVEGGYKAMLLNEEKLVLYNPVEQMLKYPTIKNLPQGRKLKGLASLDSLHSPTNY